MSLGAQCSCDRGAASLSHHSTQGGQHLERGSIHYRPSFLFHAQPSLISQLQHACKVVRHRRSYLRRMINLSTSAKKLHRLRLNSSFHSDLQWWVIFHVKWNGVSMMAAPTRASLGAIVVSDASGNWGRSAYSSQGEWFQFQWPESWMGIHITIKELLPIIMSCALWGSNCRGKTVKCVCDNAAVVAIINLGRSKDNRAMHLMRCLTFPNVISFCLLNTYQGKTISCRCTLQE